MPSAFRGRDRPKPDLVLWQVGDQTRGAARRTRLAPTGPIIPDGARRRSRHRRRRCDVDLQFVPPA